MNRELLLLFFEKSDRGLLSKAATLALSLSADVQAVYLVSDRQRIPELKKEAFLYGADEASFLVLPESLSDEAVIAGIVGTLVSEREAGFVLAPANVRFRNILPRIAARLGAGLTADCTSLEVSEAGELLQIRPAFGNRLLAEIRTERGMAMATVRENIFPPVLLRKPEKPENLYEPVVSEAEIRVKRISFTPSENNRRLSEAKIVFAGGAGIGSRENFRLMEAAAEKCGASTGASRMAVELGYAPYACQIGQTGLSIRPELYIAFGISGAVQHLLGMSSAGRIIAVNTDRKAPIFDYADEGIYGDWKEVLDKISAKL